MNSNSSPEDCYNKLEKLKEVRQKTIQVERLRFSIQDVMQDAEEEKHALEKYRKEIGLLLQEKMAHVEELRLIHTDINSMENLIKQSSQDRNNMLHDMKKQFDQFKQLKEELDCLRQEVGLEKSEDLDIDTIDVANESLGEKEVNVSNPEKISCAPETFLINEPQEKILLPPSDNGGASHPPPMKLCGSCHQYIHRNAPICPLCKAKSRSRNPKKLKKSKLEE